MVDLATANTKPTFADKIQLFFQLIGRNKNNYHAGPLWGFWRVAQTNYSVEIWNIYVCHWQSRITSIQLFNSVKSTMTEPKMSGDVVIARQRARCEKRRRPSLHLPRIVATRIEFPSLQQIGLMGSNFSRRHAGINEREQHRGKVWAVCRNNHNIPWR